MLNNELKEKLLKLQGLVDNGATEGEKSAAKKAVDRIIARYNIDASELECLAINRYVFKYSTELEVLLLGSIMRCFSDGTKLQGLRMTWDRETRKAVKQVVIHMSYINWVTIECAYEYFRKHMKQEWLRVCRPEIDRCRKSKTKKQKRQQLEDLFFQKYIIASKLYHEGEVKELDASTMSATEIENRLKLSSVKGGAYKSQLGRGLLLENK